MKITDDVFSDAIREMNGSATTQEQKSADIELPRPLRRQLPAAEPFPVDHLPEVLRETVIALANRTRAPQAICAQSVLAVSTLAVQPHADIELPTQARRPISCSYVTIAESGDRKTTADDIALQAVRKHEQQLAHEYEEHRKAYLNAFEAWQKQRAQILNDKNHSDANAKRRALDDLGNAPDAPLLPMVTCPEPTFEGLTKLLREGQPSIGLFSSEGGQFIGGVALSEENRLKTGAAFSSLWDGTPIKRVRQADGSFTLVGRRVAVHLLIQPGVGARLFSDETLNDQGTLSRLLAVYPESTAGTRLWKEPAEADFSNISRFSRLISEILATPARVENRNELTPRTMVFSPEARAVWIEFSDHIDSQLGSGGDLEPIRSFANKAPEHAARLGAILQLIADLNAECLSRDYMAAGIILAQHYLSEAFRIHHAGLDDPDLILAEKLLRWLTMEWPKRDAGGYVSLPDIYQFGPRSIRDKETAGRIVKILVEHGYLQRHDRGRVVNGQMRHDVWSIFTEDD